MAAFGTAWKDSIAPADLVQSVLRLSEAAFNRQHGDVPYLAIRLTGDAEGIAAALETSFSGVETQLARPIGAMGFHTEMASRQELNELRRSARSRAHNEDQTLARAFANAPHYLVPLKKREGVDAAFMDRISVGRAPNKDIVLRHSSISKSHAWFQFDELSTCYVADAGSKNGTRVNGSLLGPREPTQIESGDLVTFGSLEAILCDSQALWRTFHRG
jgi:hypothetical protein